MSFCSKAINVSMLETNDAKARLNARRGDRASSDTGSFIVRRTGREGGRTSFATQSRTTGGITSLQSLRTQQGGVSRPQTSFNTLGAIGSDLDDRSSRRSSGITAIRASAEGRAIIRQLRTFGSSPAIQSAAARTIQTLRAAGQNGLAARLEKKVREESSPSFRANRDARSRRFGGFRPEGFSEGRFNSGGSVPGRGNTDSVAALLTPGEFVFNKKATAAAGMGNLQRFNKRFQNGGAVAGGAVSSGGGGTSIMSLDSSSQSALNAFAQAVPSLDSFANAVAAFSTAAQALASVIIPDTIQVSVAPVQVSVNVNGAEALANIEQPIQQMIAEQVNAAINKNINTITGETNEGFLQ